MSKRQKLITRFQSLPRDFTWNELEQLLSIFGYEVDRKGKSSGSRVKFYKNGGASINLHKPHPSSVIKMYALKQIKEFLADEEGLR